MFELVAHLGVSYESAYTIANAILAGMDLASVVSLASGVGSLISLWWTGIKYIAKTKSKTALVSW